jgi:hypothetical protein
VIGRVPGGLNPPVAAHHRGRHCHRLQPDHQVPGPDPARPRPLSAPSGRPYPGPAAPDRPRQPPRPQSRPLPEQAQHSILRTTRRDIPRQDRVEGHQGSREGKVARHFLFYREPAGHGGTSGQPPP